MTLDSATWSSSKDTGTNPAASETTSAPGCTMTLLVLTDLFLSIVRGELSIATVELITPPKLDDDLVRSTTGIGGLRVCIGVLVLFALAGIGQSSP